MEMLFAHCQLCGFMVVALTEDVLQEGVEEHSQIHDADIARFGPNWLGHESPNRRRNYLLN